MSPTHVHVPAFGLSLIDVPRIFTRVLERKLRMLQAELMLCYGSGERICECEAGTQGGLHICLRRVGDHDPQILGSAEHCKQMQKRSFWSVFVICCLNA